MIEKVIFKAPCDAPVNEFTITVKLDKDFIIEDPEELVAETIDFVAWAEHCQKEWGDLENTCAYYNDTPRIGHKPRR